MAARAEAVPLIGNAGSVPVQLDGHTTRIRPAHLLLSPGDLVS
ncbi:MAG TPA: hypothetical protein VLA19_19330 [Herpetosiphonaceae bacterium]|nr:hypothetical protein [Herpetosiphonaceae bacterium]